MTACASPGCAAAGTVEGRFSTWCADHAAILRRLAAECGERPKRTKKNPPAKTGADRSKLDEANARKMAAAVRAAAEPVAAADLAERVGMHSANATAYKNALELAKARGWVAIRPGRGFIAGPSDPPDTPISAALGRAERRPRRERAVTLAEAVHAADDPLNTDTAAEAVGVTPASLKRVAQYAIKRGWIESRRGRGGGYVPGSVPLPQDA